MNAAKEERPDANVLRKDSSYTSSRTEIYLTQSCSAEIDRQPHASPLSKLPFWLEELYLPLDGRHIEREQIRFPSNFFGSVSGAYMGSVSEPLPQQNSNSAEHTRDNIGQGSFCSICEHESQSNLDKSHMAVANTRSPSPEQYQPAPGVSVAPDWAQNDASPETIITGILGGSSPRDVTPNKGIGEGFAEHQKLIAHKVKETTAYKQDRHKS